MGRSPAFSYPEFSLWLCENTGLSVQRRRQALFVLGQIFSRVSRRPTNEALESVCYALWRERPNQISPRTVWNFYAHFVEDGGEGTDEVLQKLTARLRSYALDLLEVKIAEEIARFAYLTDATFHELLYTHPNEMECYIKDTRRVYRIDFGAAYGKVTRRVFFGLELAEKDANHIDRKVSVDIYEKMLDRRDDLLFTNSTRLVDRRFLQRMLRGVNHVPRDPSIAPIGRLLEGAFSDFPDGYSLAPYSPQLTPSLAELGSLAQYLSAPHRRLRPKLVFR